MKEHILYKLNSFIISLIFCIAIFIPFAIGVIEKDKDISEIEKRNLSNYPETPQSVEDIKKYPKLFETYYSDHFGLRDWFTKYYKLVKYNLGDSPSKDVLIGKDGWLFLGSIKNGYTKYSDPVGDFRNINLYSQEDLKEFAEFMIVLNSWLKKRGIAYVFVIAPNKHTIYFDKLPDYISRVNEYSATDQLVKYLKQHTDVSVVDLRKQLIKEKDKHQVYYKSGTHWNQYGANVAQYEIMTEIKKIFPGKIQPEMEKIRSGTVIDGQELANYIGVNIFKEDYPSPIFKQTCTPKKYPSYAHKRKPHTMICDDNELNAIIFRDSFFTALQPYFSRKFKRTTYLWEKLNYPSLIKYVELEKPDVIIEEWVERSVPYIPKVIHEFNSSLDKEIVNNRYDLIYSNNWKNLEVSNCINEKNVYLLIKYTDQCLVPRIKFPLIPFESNNRYIFHIKMTSTVHTKLMIYYSDANQSGYPFSEINSIKYSVNKGENDIYVRLDHQFLGKYLRLDPIHNPGEVIIKSLEIKKLRLGI